MDISGLGSDIPQIIVRSLKSMGDPKELLKYIESHQANETSEADEEVVESPVSESNKSEENFIQKQEYFYVNVAPAVTIQYCDLFNQRFSTILSTLENQTKCHNQSLKQILIFLLDELTLKAFNIFVNFVQELVVRVMKQLQTQLQANIDFDCFLKIVFAQFVERSMKEKCRDINSFVLSLNDERKRYIDFDIRDYLGEQTAESITNLEIAFDTSHTYKADLSVDRKVYLLIEEHVDEIVEQFEPCCATANIYELNETITDILKRLSAESATIFFALAKKLLKDHAVNIQLSLGRFISVDIFITDIYCLLIRISSESECESLNEYLFQYTDDLYDAVEKEFKLNYILTIDGALKKIPCNICAGELFV